MISSIILMFLGVLIMISQAVYETNISRGYFQLFRVDPVTNLPAQMVLHWPVNVEPFQLTLFYFFVGLAVFGCALTQFILFRRQKESDGKNHSLNLLALAQICFGIALIALMIWYLVGIEPYLNSFPSEVIAANGGPGVVFHDPGWERLLISWKIAGFVLGMAVTALGVIQFGRLQAAVC